MKQSPIRSIVGITFPKLQANCVRSIMRVALCLGIALHAHVGAAQNLAQNPGFETGTTSGWFAFGPPTISAQTAQVHSGSYAALVDGRTSSWNGIAQSFQAVFLVGETYDISVWVRMASGTSQTVQVTIQKTDGSGTTYSVVVGGSASSSGWTQLTGQYTHEVSGALSGLNLYVEVPSSPTQSFYVDDLVVQQVGGPSPGGEGSAVVDWNDVHQVIDGFGASSAWRGNWSTALANMLFSTNSGTGTAKNGSSYSYTGVGLSLLRTRIAPGGTTVEQSIMQMAQARGARVWSAPWSPAPAAQFKDNGNVNGGAFIGKAANYQAYANQMAGYVLNMKNQYGINLSAISVQNEPDANVTTYESCNWTAQQIHDFIPYLSAALAASNVAATKIMLPESQNWTDPGNLHGTTMNDPTTAAMVGIIANHNYVANNSIGDQATPAAINSYGKALWQTEVAKLSGNDSSIADGLYWAGRVHLFMTAAQANAWHYWWLCAYGTSNEGLCDTNDVPAKRMYTLGNFSRFVRPGFNRIGVTTNSGILPVSAYKNLTNGSFAIVVINPTGSNITQTFNFSGCSVSSVIPWLTSASASLAAQTIVPVNGSIFSNTIPAMSVVTFTGQVTNSPPALTPVSNVVVGAGVTLNVTNTASDADSPPQTLTFTLLTGPTNASLNASNGILAWRPLIGQANTTNSVTIMVADNGSPSLSATNSYTVTVSPLTSPGLTSINLSGDEVSLVATGALGPDYALLTSTNLADWQTLLVTNPVAMPLQMSATNSADPQRYYRLQLGP